MNLNVAIASIVSIVCISVWSVRAIVWLWDLSVSSPRIDCLHPGAILGGRMPSKTSTLLLRPSAGVLEGRGLPTQQRVFASVRKWLICPKPPLICEASGALFIRNRAHLANECVVKTVRANLLPSICGEGPSWATNDRR